MTRYVAEMKRKTEPERIAEAGRRLGWTETNVRKAMGRKVRPPDWLPHATAIAAFCNVANVSPTWLLLGIGPVSARAVADGAQLDADTLGRELAAYVAQEVERRVAARYVEQGFGMSGGGTIRPAPDAASRLLAFVVDAAESALRAAAPVIQAREALAAAIKAVEAEMPSRADTEALQRIRTDLRRLWPPDPSVPLADDPPVGFRFSLRPYLTSHHTDDT